MYGGYPPKDLRHKFLLAQESNAVDITSADFPKEVEIIPLPGHFFDMVGYKMPDGVCFMADCVSSAATLEKYRVGYIYDVKAYLETLDYIEALEAPVFVPAHTEAVSSMAELAQLNRGVVLEIIDKLLDICAEPLCFESILQSVFTDYGLVMNFEQYVLVGNAIKSYLAYLRDSGKVDITYVDNMMLWVKI